MLGSVAGRLFLSYLGVVAVGLLVAAITIKFFSCFSVNSSIVTATP